MFFWIGYIICERRKIRKRLEKGVVVIDINDWWGEKKKKKYWRKFEIILIKFDDFSVNIICMYLYKK